MISSCFTRHSFQNVHQPWWTVYNDFYPVPTEVTSNLLSLAWRLRLHPIVGSNDPKPDPIYARIRLAFHPKCALSARKCIAQYRLKFQIIHCQFFFEDPPLPPPPPPTHTHHAHFCFFHFCKVTNNPRLRIDFSEKCHPILFLQLPIYRHYLGL